ncbi:MAG TPA: hypothetical protein VHE83_06115 [Mycobacteriales bacterium]|nr:hypothetical protein [Mycobacteriales bacterium]
MTGRGADGLASALAAFDRRARAYAPNAWRAAGRADIAFGLAGRLIELARAAGDEVPAGTPIPQVADHGIADVLSVLSADLVAALSAHPDDAVTAEAVQAVTDALTALEATAPRP